MLYAVRIYVYVIFVPMNGGEPPAGRIPFQTCVQLSLSIYISYMLYVIRPQDSPNMAQDGPKMAQDGT